MLDLEKRSVVLNVVLCFVTLGLWGIYWFICLTNDANRAAGEEYTASGGMALLYSLLTCGIYSLYWSYKIAGAINQARQTRGLSVDTNMGLVYLIFSIFGLSIVAMAMAQNSLNQIIEKDDAAAV